jgi:outer membrane protein TolC
MLASVLGALLAAAPPAPTFDPMHLTLEQAIAASDESHLDVALARLQLASTQQDERGSYAYILPRVDLGATAQGTYSAPQTAYNVYPVTAPNGTVAFQASQVNLPGYATPDFNLGVKVTQPLYDGGRWWTAIDRGQVDTSGAKANLQEARLKAHAEVAHDFFEVVRASRQLQVLQSNVQRSQEQVQRAEGLFDAGKGSKGDILAAQVNLANDQITILQQQAALDLAKTNLNVVLGLATKAPLEVVSPDLSARPELLPREELEKRAEDHRPGLQALREASKSAQLTTRIARADYYPTVSVTASYYRESPNPVLVVGNPARQFIAQGAVNFGWNLFSGHTTDVNVEKSHLAEAQADTNLEKSRRALAAEVERAARTFEAAAASADLSEKARAVASQGLEVANERFRLGSANSLEVRDAQLKLTQAELALVGTQIDLQLAAVDLQAALGEL